MGVGPQPTERDQEHTSTTVSSIKIEQFIQDTEYGRLLLSRNKRARTHEVDPSRREREGAGSGWGADRRGAGSGAADGEPHLAGRLTQTIKTAEARIQNLGEGRKGHFCIGQETRFEEKKKETVEQVKTEKNNRGRSRPLRWTKCTSLGCVTYFWKE